MSLCSESAGKTENNEKYADTAADKACKSHSFTTGFTWTTHNTEDDTEWQENDLQNNIENTKTVHPITEKCVVPCGHNSWNNRSEYQSKKCTQDTEYHTDYTFALGSAGNDVCCRHTRLNILTCSRLIILMAVSQQMVDNWIKVADIIHRKRWLYGNIKRRFGYY